MVMALPGATVASSESAVEYVFMPSSYSPRRIYSGDILEAVEGGDGEGTASKAKGAAEEAGDVVVGVAGAGVDANLLIREDKSAGNDEDDDDTFPCSHDGAATDLAVASSLTRHL